MNLGDLIIVAAAAMAVIVIWFLPNGLFAAWLAYFEARGGVLGKLFTCRTCLTVHVVGWLIVIFEVPAWFLQEPWSYVWRLPLYILAASGVVYAGVALVDAGAARRVRMEAPDWEPAFKDGGFDEKQNTTSSA